MEVCHTFHKSSGRLAMVAAMAVVAAVAAVAVMTAVAAVPTVENVFFFGQLG